jgi:ABC-type nickel/cobalt efflux system permease component RcnA
MELEHSAMNLENVSAFIVRLFGAFQFYQAVDDLVYCLAKHATDPLFKSYHYYALMIGFRLLIGLTLIRLAAPLGRRLLEGLR